jgi:hypothetical protein
VGSVQVPSLSLLCFASDCSPARSSTLLHLVTLASPRACGGIGGRQREGNAAGRQPARRQIDNMTCTGLSTTLSRARPLPVFFPPPTFRPDLHLPGQQARCSSTENGTRQCRARGKRRGVGVAAGGWESGEGASVMERGKGRDQSERQGKNDPTLSGGRPSLPVGSGRITC